jgi:hypothetical protein
MHAISLAQSAPMSAFQSGKSVQTNSSVTKQQPAISWLPKVIAVLGALLLIAGALIALFHPVMLVPPYDEINGAVHIYAGYLASRNLAMAVMLLVALAVPAKRWLNNLLLLLSLVQFLDAVIDVVEGRWPVAIGVMLLALVFLFAFFRSSVQEDPHLEGERLARRPTHQSES